MDRRKIFLEICSKALNEGRNWLLEPEAKEICRIYGLPVTKLGVARNEEELLKLSKEIGYPIVLKILSPNILHKSDVGGVLVGLKNETEVLNGYRQIINNVKKNKPDAIINGVVVQEMAPPSTEVIIGVTKDPQFGHAIMFGLGGIFVELFKDVSFRIIPITKRDAEEMIREIKGYALLKGYRGKPPADVNSLINTLLTASQIIEENHEISEMDLNPILVYESGIKIVDARIVIGGVEKCQT
ncbi:MAG: acetate--CoA ligase family protein [Nitrososphaeria archaeon]